MRVKNRSILITGGCGFIGSAITQRLAARNKICIVDNGRRDALRYFPVRRHKNVRVVKEDILKPRRVKDLIKNCDTVIHLAAMAGVSSYYESPVRTMEVNFLGTYNILNAVKETDLGLFLNFSTSEVYGPYADNVKENGLTCQGNPQDPRWSYSVSKLAAEHLSFAFRRKYGLPVASVRPFNIYGPGQIGEGAIQAFLNNVLRNEPLEVSGDGRQVRAWCYIDDLVDAVELILDNKRAVGNIFNIGNPACAVNTLNLAKKIIKITGSGSKITFKKHIGTDIMYRVPNIKAARQILGFSPCFGLDEGISLSFDWYKNNLRASGQKRHE